MKAFECREIKRCSNNERLRDAVIMRLGKHVEKKNKRCLGREVQDENTLVKMLQ